MEVTNRPRKMEDIKVSEIIIENRTREEFGSLSELVDSIKEQGVIQPITAYTDKEGKIRLLSGERRIRACIKAGVETIPALIYLEEPNEYDRKCIEFYENLHRKNLEWWEEIKFTKILHEQFVKIYGEKVSPTSPGWAQKDTAKAIGKDPGGVSKDMKMAGIIEEFPELTKVKTKQEAVKIMQAIGKDLVAEERVKKLRKHREETPIAKVREQLEKCYVVGDGVEGMKSVESASRNLVEIDSPFGVGLDKTKKSKDPSKLVMVGYDEWLPEEYRKNMEVCIKEAWRIITPDGWLILWGALDKYGGFLNELLAKAGFKFGIPAIWTKGSGQTERPEYYLGSSYEQFIYARKGSPSIIRKGRSNEFKFKPIPPIYKVHATEKSIQLYQEILSTFLWEETRVFCPFLGSGNINLAASNLGISCFGYDLSESNRNNYIIKVHEGEPGLYRSKVGE